MAYNAIMYFGIVAFSEEGAKYFLLRRRTWHSAAFNCQFDGVVYAVFVALGFALWENISYVLMYGLSTALVRAISTRCALSPRWGTYSCTSLPRFWFSACCKASMSGGSASTAMIFGICSSSR